MKPIYQQSNRLIYQLNKNDFTAELIYSPEATGKIFFPRSIEHESQEYILTRIGKNAFKNNYNIISVDFEQDSELQTICSNAFTKSSIKSITIPSKVEIIEDGWCKNMTFLHHIYLSPKNKNFKYLDENKNIIVGKSNPTNEIFDAIYVATCKNANITIPSTITEIRPYAFSNANLSRLTFEKDSKLKRIGREAFTSNFLKNIEIPSSVELLEDGWIGERKNQLTVKIHPENKFYKSLDDFLIVGKSNPDNDEYDVLVVANSDISEVFIPSSIKIIGSFAFNNCSNFLEVKFQNDSKLEIIGKSAFSMTQINSIKIPASVKQIGKHAFYSCRKLKSIDFDENSKLEKMPKKILVRSGIESLTIPKNVEIFEDKWNKDAYHLKDLNISKENQNLSYLDDKHKIVIGKTNLMKDEFDVLIFSSVSIQQAFIPSTIKYIKPYAFANCNKLKNIEFSEDTKIETFEHSLFIFCTNLERIKIPSSVKHICSQCFFACTNLNTVEIHTNSQLETIGRFAFFNNQIESLFFPSKLETLEDFWQSDMQNLVNIEISPENENFKYLDDEHKMIVRKTKFSNIFDVLIFACHDIKRAFIPSSIRYISANSFYSCTDLVDVEFEKNSELQIIGINAFSKTSIEKIIIPPHVKYICIHCFGMCQNLKKFYFEKNSEKKFFDYYMFDTSPIKSIMIPSKLQKLKKDWCAGNNSINEVIISPDNEYFSYIDDSHKLIACKSNKNDDKFDVLAFVCRDVKEVTIPETIRVIGPNSFSYGKIERIFIPKNVRIICFAAFFQCRNLKTIEFDESSELEKIQNNSLLFLSIKNIIFPRKIKKFDLDELIGCHDLKNIEFLGDEMELNGLFYIKKVIIISFPNSYKVIIRQNAIQSFNENISLFVNSNSFVDIID